MIMWYLLVQLLVQLHDTVNHNNTSMLHESTDRSLSCLTSLILCRGYDQYDIVAQFDCDHIPAATYLTSCLPAFMDSSIGYVAAPSVNSLGSTNSWAARGRLHYEGIFHGAGQAAWFPGWMPVCIGSHYTVRTAHLKSVSQLNL